MSQDLLNSSDRDSGFSKLRQDPSHHPYRPNEHVHDRQEKEKAAYAQAASGQPYSAAENHNRDLTHAQQVRSRPIAGQQPIEPIMQIPMRSISEPKFLDLMLLAREGAHHANAGEVFLQRAGEAPFGSIDCLEPGAYFPKERNGENHDGCDE